MKVAHIYPGLRYRSATMQREILCDQKVLERLRMASTVLRKDIQDAYPKPRLFETIKDCYVITLAMCVAVGEYYAEKHGQPQLIAALSFGHIASLVMAESLSFEEALDFVSSNARIIDREFANHVTCLINGIPEETLYPFLFSFQQREQTILSDYPDGTALIIRREAYSEVEQFVATCDGKVTTIPLRLPYHTEPMQRIDELIQPDLERLSIEPPQTPIISSFSVDFIDTPNKIRSALENRLSAPQRYNEVGTRLKKEDVTEAIVMTPARPRIIPINQL